MKYIKLYEAFRINIMSGHQGAREVSYIPGDNREQTIREICLELEDIGYGVIINRFKTTSEVFFYLDNDDSDDDHYDEKRISWSEIKEYLLRIKDYLGDDYIRFTYLDRTMIDGDKKIGWYVAELNEESSLNDSFGYCIKYKK